METEAGRGGTTLTFPSRWDCIHLVTQVLSTQDENPAGNILAAYLLLVYKMTNPGLSLPLLSLQSVHTVRLYMMGAGDSPHLDHSSL